MLTQVSQNLRELLSLEFDFAFDFEADDKKPQDAVMAEPAAFAGLNTSFNKAQEGLDMGEEAKMYFAEENFDMQDDYFGKGKKARNDSMDVEMDDYQQDKIFDDDF